MRFKADVGERNTALFKEVKLNRGHPMASWTVPDKLELDVYVAPSCYLMYDG